MYCENQRNEKVQSTLYQTINAKRGYFKSKNTVNCDPTSYLTRIADQGFEIFKPVGYLALEISGHIG